MPTFSLGHWTRQTNTRNQPLHKSLRLGVVATTSPAKINWIISTVDMRGIPAIGPNCPGRIHGTRPDQIADRD